MPRRSSKDLDWYTEQGGVFDALYLEETKNIISVQRTKKEVDFIENVLGLSRSARILDLACGEGRHSLELARRGYTTVGQDINSEFLKIARRKKNQEKLAIKFIKGDMRKISFNNAFDAVLLLFNSFGYFFKESDHQKVLNQISLALKPKGKLVLDLDNIKRYQDRGRMVYKSELTDHISTKLISEYDKKNRILNQERIRCRDNKEIQVLHSRIRMFEISEIEGMLNKAGLKFMEAFADYEKAKPIKESKRTVIIASKE